MNPFKSIKDPLVISLLLGSIWTKTAFMMSIPFLAIYLAKHTALSGIAIGFVISAAPVMACASSFFSGYLADVLGRTIIMRVALWASSATFFGFFAAAYLPKGSAAQTIAFLILNGIVGMTSSMFGPSAQALIIDRCPDENRAFVLRLRYMLMNAGAMIGGLAGGIGGSVGGQWVFLASATLYFGYALMLGRLFRVYNVTWVRPARTAGAPLAKLTEAVRVIAGDGAFRRLLVSGILFSAAYMQIDTNVARLISTEFEGGTRIVGYLLSLNAFLVVVLIPTVEPLVRKFSNARLMLVGSVIFSAGFLPMQLMGFSLPALVLMIVLISVGEVIIGPLQNVAIDVLAPVHLRGSYFGASSFRFVGEAFGPVGGAFVIQSYGFLSVFHAMAVLAICAGLLAVTAMSVPPRVQQPLAA